MFFIPVIMSALAVGYIWQAVLKSDGALNQILSFITGQNIDIAWLGSTTWTIVVVAAIHGLEVDGTIDAHLLGWSKNHRF